MQLVLSLIHIADTISPVGLPNVPPAGSTPVDPGMTAIKTIFSVGFVITALISVLIITIAGFRFILSRGDPNGVAQARNTIIYAVIGLVVSLAAFSIVTLVIGRV